MSKTDCIETLDDENLAISLIMAKVVRAFLNPDLVLAEG